MLSSCQGPGFVYPVFYNEVGFKPQNTEYYIRQGQSVARLPHEALQVIFAALGQFSHILSALQKQKKHTFNAAQDENIYLKIAYEQKSLATPVQNH